MDNYGDWAFWGTRTEADDAIAAKMGWEGEKGRIKDVAPPQDVIDAAIMEDYGGKNPQEGVWGEMLGFIDPWLEVAIEGGRDDTSAILRAIRRTLKAVEGWRKEAGELIGVSRGLETVNLLFRIRDFDPGKE